MKIIRLKVDINLDAHISDDKEIKEVATNVLVALVNKTLNDFISPDDSEAMVTSIVVSEKFTQTELKHSLV